MPLTFDKGQIPQQIGNLGQVDQAAVSEGHEVIFYCYL
jgi:hypothetical protein